MVAEKKITIKNGHICVPDEPIIPYIEGDGTGPDIWRATSRVVEAAVAAAYQGQKRIAWKEVLAGEKAYKLTGQWLPKETLDAVREYIVAIKGPLTTPVGEGIRSINVAMRQTLDLYACIRPVKWIEGVPSPVLQPGAVNIVIFRENTEDTYAGIEWEQGSSQALEVRRYLNDKMCCAIPEDAGIGIKYMSRHASERIMRKALDYALAHRKKTVTIVHKGNIMKYTEGAFRKWCYDLAKREYSGAVVTEDVLKDCGGRIPDGKVLINDRIADNMFQQLIIRAADYEVIVTPNLNGDYLSDAAAAQVGGLGMAPGANIGDGFAVFEATHGTAPKYAGLDKINPGSLILSAVMMLEYLGWQEAAALISGALEKTIKQKKVTYDLARLIEGAEEMSTSQFAAAIIKNMQ